MMITWIHYVSKKYRRQADRKVILLIGAWGQKISVSFSISVYLPEKNIAIQCIACMKK